MKSRSGAQAGTVLFIAALEREMSSLSKGLGPAATFGDGAFLTRVGSIADVPVALVISGMGGKRTSTATACAIETYVPKAVVALGFCGAAINGLAPGHLVVCRSLQQWDNVSDAVAADQHLLELADAAALGSDVSHTSGSCLTLPYPALAPGEKERWNRERGVQAVDMEGYWVGKEAQARGIPFVAVRAVVDPLGLSLSGLPSWTAMSDGGMSPWKWIAHSFAHPRFLALAPRLASYSARASRALGAWARAFLDLAYAGLNIEDFSLGKERGEGGGEVAGDGGHRFHRRQSGQGAPPARVPG